MQFQGFGVIREVTQEFIRIENSISRKEWKIMLADITNPALKYASGIVVDVWYDIMTDRYTINAGK